MAQSFDNTSDVIASATLSGHEKLLTKFVRVSQFLTWPFLFIYFHTFFRVKIRGMENFHSVKSPFIVIANHVAMYDSFLFRLALGFYTPHLPLRFMAVRRFNFPFLNFLSKIGVVSFIYALFGVFIVVPGEGLDKNLSEARSIIRSGGNVAIFPEGKIVDKGKIAVFHKGAAVLAAETGVSVVPVAFHLGQRRLFRRSLAITVGEAIPTVRGTSVQSATNIFFGRVCEMYLSDPFSE